jgi:hypothetical protein
MTLISTSLGCKNSFENKLFISARIEQYSFAILDFSCTGIFDPSRDISWEFPGQGWEEVRGGSEIYKRRHAAECGQFTLEHWSGRITADSEVTAQATFRCAFDQRSADPEAECRWQAQSFWANAFGQKRILRQSPLRDAFPAFTFRVKPFSAVSKARALFRA